MFKNIVYIHGYTGDHGYNKNSPKVAELQRYADHKGVKLHAEQYPDKDPHEAYAELSNRVKKLVATGDHPLLVGTSMGGFWAHRLSNEHSLPSIIINPAREPTKTLQRHVGKNGLSQVHVDSYKDFLDEHHDAKRVHAPRIVLLEKGDDVLDSAKTAREYKGHADVRVFPGGNHPFTRHAEITKAAEELHNTIVNKGD